MKEKVIAMLANPENSSFVKNVEGEGWEPEFIRALNVLTCSYHLYYYKSEDMLEKEMKNFKEGTTRAEVVKKLEEELFEFYKDPNLSIKRPQLEERGGVYYSDAAVRLISSIYNDKRDIQPVNTINNGAIASLPYDSAVEVSCVITKEGPKPIISGDLLVAVKGLVQQIKSFERVAAKAAVTGNYDTALLAMTINPLMPSDEAGEVILNEMLEAHKKNSADYGQW